MRLGFEMRGSWTVFYNLSIVSLLGAAGYIGSGENSVFALHQIAQPEPTAVDVTQAVVAPLRNATTGSYVPGASSIDGPIVLASYSANPAGSDSASEPIVVEAPASIESPLILVTATVTGEAVNLRLGPSTEFDKIGAVVFGDQLVLTGKTDGPWAQVQHPVDGSPVWISQKFIN